MKCAARMTKSVDSQSVEAGGAHEVVPATETAGAVVVGDDATRLMLAGVGVQPGRHILAGGDHQHRGQQHERYRLHTD